MLEVPDGLSVTVLQDLYLVQLKTETEIARLFGTHQVKINKLRRVWGIPTLGKTGRLAQGLPLALTSEQEQVLIGSLLGDGWLDAPSARTARFNEGHCIQQADYVKWKGGQLRPFTCSFRDGRKVDRVTGKTFLSYAFSTHTCTVLRPYYDLFYPAPARVRVFPKDLPDRMTPLVLAVWYMDDGGVDSYGRPKVSFGLDDRSRTRALQALRKLGLKPVVYGEGGDQGIHFPKQALEFRALVEPHLVPCMVYKLPTATPRRIVDRNARGLNPEKAKGLYEGGASVEQIAELFGVGCSTVSRRLSVAGVLKRSSGPYTRRYTVEAAEELLCQYDTTQWAELAPDVQEQRLAEILLVLQSTPFPYPARPSKEEALRILGQVQEAPMRLEIDRLVPLRWFGVGLCGSFFPNRYRASNRETPTAWEAWHDVKLLRRAVQFQLRVGDPVIPKRVLRAVTANCRTPTVFRPTVARFIYQRYCPSGGLVWDPCAGYGGRLLGAVAAGVRYVGTDVDEETVQGNLELARFLDRQVDVQCCPAEQFDPPRVDLVFTSPPYFDQERYSGRAEQSWKQYGTFETWLEGFLRLVIRKAFRVSPKLVLNVADVRKNPLVESTKRLAQEEGWEFIEELRMPLPKLNRVDPCESILVFERGDRASSEDRETSNRVE